MSDKSRSEYLTKMERLRFDAIATYDTMKAAALSLGMTPNALYTWKWNLKKKYRRLRGRVNAILAQTRRHNLKNLLYEKRKMALPDEE